MKTVVQWVLSVNDFHPPIFMTDTGTHMLAWAFLGFVLLFHSSWSKIDETVVPIVRELCCKFEQRQ